MSFLNNVDTGGTQNQTQLSPDAIKSAQQVAGGSNKTKTTGESASPGILQPALDFINSMSKGGQGGGSLADKPIEPVSLKFTEASSSVKNFLSSPIMAPLYEMGGIIFPNTPRLSVTYTTSYSPIELSHGNYDFHAFNKSSIQTIAIDAKLTAQTISEADYMLAVIHFMRTYNKMNFGVNDEERGQPPAILKVSGYGDFMIKDHPVAIRTFVMNLPDNIDYVQTSHNTQVPVYFEFNIDLVTMMTPNDVMNEFSLEDFANGSLITKGYI